MPKKTISLSEDALGILARQTNISQYISNLVVQRRQEWMAALITLQTAGWSNKALLAACDALNGTWLVDRPIKWLAIELFDAERLNQTATRQWGVDGKEWGRLVEEVGENEQQASALRVLVTEFWTYNSELEDRLRAE